MKGLKSIQIDYKKGETILRPEDTPQGVYYLKKGFVKIYLVSEKGKEIILNILKPPTYFPLQWALDNYKNEYFYEAMTNSSVLRIKKDDFMEYISEYPSISIDLLKNFIDQLEIIYMRMSHAIGDNAYKRVCSTILLLSKRYGEKIGDTIQIIIPVTHLCIASIAGLTRETTSTTLKVIANTGAISYRYKKITVLKEKLLL